MHGNHPSITIELFLLLRTLEESFMMAMRLCVLFAILTGCLVPFVQAESTDCTTPVLIITDGRVTQSTFPQSTTYWYGIYAQAGHSYSVEFEPPADNYVSVSQVQFSALGVYSPSDPLQACRGTSSVNVTQNSGYAPVILKTPNGAGRRISFTAQTAGLHLISATNIRGTGSYTFRAVDTTMFNVRWSTWGGYGCQWGFLNVSDFAVTGILTVYDVNSRLLVSTWFVVPAAGEVIKKSYSNDLNLPANVSGFATFSHNGPPGAIIADAYMINSTGMVVTYTKFEGIERR